MTCISLESLRAMDFDGIEAQLLAVHDYGHVIVNAVADCDVKVFAVALYRAMAKGRHFTIRSAPHWSRPSAIFPTSRCSPGKRWSRRKARQAASSWWAATPKRPLPSWKN